MPYNNPIQKKSSSCMQMKDHKGKPTGLMMEGSLAHMESVMQEKKNLMQDMPIDNRGVGEMSPYKMDHGSAALHAGKSKLHKDPNKDMPDDGHKHKGGKNPTQEEGKQLMDISGAVGQMSPYKFTGMSAGSAMHAHGPGGSHPDTDPKLDEFGNPIPEGFKADASEVTGIVRRVSDKPISSKDTNYLTYPTVRDVEGKPIPGAGRYLSMEVERDRAEGSRPPSYKNIIPRGNIKDVMGRSAEKFLTVETTSPRSKKISFTRPMFK